MVHRLLKIGVLVLFSLAVTGACTSTGDSGSSDAAGVSPVPYQVVSTEDIGGLAWSKRLDVRVLVPDSIKRQQVEPTVKTVLDQVRSGDPDVDEINLLVYSHRELIDGAYDVARAVWAPGGEFGNISPEAARSNERDGYETKIQVKDNLEEYLAQRGQKETKGGLTEEERRKIFRELVKAEDRATRKANQKYPIDMNCVSPEQAKANVEPNGEMATRLTEKFTREVREKYGISEETADEITAEAFQENWPMPEMPPSSC